MGKDLIEFKIPVILSKLLYLESQDRNTMKEEGLTYSYTSKKTGLHIIGYLNPQKTQIYWRLLKENPERYKDDPELKKMRADIEAELAKEK